MSLSVAACARCHCALEKGDLRCAICGFAAQADAARHAQHVEARVLRCESCGAAVRYDVEARAPRCGFCGSVMHVEGVADPMEQTEWYLSFAVAPESAQEALRGWMRGLGFFRPSDLVSESTIEKLEPLYWVGWAFDGTARVSWTADSDAGSGRSDWAPHAGQLDVAFERVLVSASRGLSADETRALAPSYDLTRSARDPYGPPGAFVEQFDVQRSSARERIVEAAERVALERVQRGAIPGSRFRNVRVAALLASLRTHRCAFPAYVLAYRYRGDLYRAVVSGQDAARIVGTAPYSWWKIGATVAAVVLFLGAIAALLAG